MQKRATIMTAQLMKCIFTTTGTQMEKQGVTHLPGKAPSWGLGATPHQGTAVLTSNCSH